MGYGTLALSFFVYRVILCQKSKVYICVDHDLEIERAAFNFHKMFYWLGNGHFSTKNMSFCKSCGSFILDFRPSAMEKLSSPFSLSRYKTSDSNSYNLVLFAILDVPFGIQ